MVAPVSKPQEIQYLLKLFFFLHIVIYIVYIYINRKILCTASAYIYIYPDASFRSLIAYKQETSLLQECN